MGFTCVKHAVYQGVKQGCDILVRILYAAMHATLVYRVVAECEWGMRSRWTKKDMKQRTQRINSSNSLMFELLHPSDAHLIMKCSGMSRSSRIRRGVFSLTREAPTASN